MTCKPDVLGLWGALSEDVVLKSLKSLERLVNCHSLDSPVNGIRAMDRLVERERGERERERERERDGERDGERERERERERDPRVDEASDVDESHLRGEIITIQVWVVSPKSTENEKKNLIYKWYDIYI